MDAVQTELSIALRATTHRKLCAEKGIPESEWGRWSALFSRVLKGYSVSARARNEVRVFLGLEPEMLPVPVLPCPTCGKVHTYNCGREVVKPKPANKPKRSKRKPRKRKRYWRPAIPAELRHELEPQIKRLMDEAEHG